MRLSCSTHSLFPKSYSAAAPAPTIKVFRLHCMLGASNRISKASRSTIRRLSRLADEPDEPLLRHFYISPSGLPRSLTPLLAPRYLKSTSRSETTRAALPHSYKFCTFCLRLLPRFEALQKETFFIRHIMSSQSDSFLSIDCKPQRQKNLGAEHFRGLASFLLT